MGTRARTSEGTLEYVTVEIMTLDILHRACCYDERGSIQRTTSDDNASYVSPSQTVYPVQRSTALFKLLDTDRNGLIDAIEFISAMACASGEMLEA